MSNDKIKEQLLFTQQDLPRQLEYIFTKGKKVRLEDGMASKQQLGRIPKASFDNGT